MSTLEHILLWYLGLWFITLPLTILFIVHVVPEMLDIIFNTGRINKMLKYSDNLDIESMKTEYNFQRNRRLILNSSNLEEVKRQVEFSKLSSKGEGPRNSIDEENKIKTAKYLSDIFRTDS